MRHVLAGVGGFGLEFARRHAHRYATVTDVLLADLNPGPDGRWGEMGGIRTHSHALSVPTGRSTGRAWYLGRLAAERVTEAPLPAADRLTTAIAAGGGTAAGAAPLLARDIISTSGSGFHCGLVAVPPAKTSRSPEDVNAAYALGSLADARVNLILVGDPGHVAELRRIDEDPFRLGTADSVEHAMSQSLAEALAGLENLAAAGWRPQDFAATFNLSDRGPSRFCVPAVLHVREDDLRRVNLAGWILASLETATLASTCVENADALLVHALIPAQWRRSPGYRSRDEILSLLKAILPDAPIELEVNTLSDPHSTGRIYAYIVTRDVPRVMGIAQAGALEMVEPSFERSVTTALNVLGDVGSETAASYVEEYRAAVKHLALLLRATKP